MIVSGHIYFYFDFALSSITHILGISCPVLSRISLIPDLLAFLTWFNQKRRSPRAQLPLRSKNWNSPHLTDDFDLSSAFLPIFSVNRCPKYQGLSTPWIKLDLWQLVNSLLHKQLYLRTHNTSNGMNHGFEAFLVFVW